MSIDRKIRELNHKRIDQMRAFKLGLAKFLFSPFAKFKKTQTAGAILVLRLDGKLGDGVTATGFLKALKAHFPQSPLIVATNASTLAVYENLDFVDQVVAVKKGFIATLGLYFKLKKENYNFIINTSHILNPRVVFLVSLLTAYKKIGFANKEFKMFSDHVAINFKTGHVTQRYLQALNILGVAQANLDYQLPVSPTALKQTSNFINAFREQSLFIVALNSFAGANLRNLSEGTTKAIVNKLLEKENIVVLSLANEGDHRILKSWIQAAGQRRWVQAPQFSSLEQNVALLSQCDLLITPDTAWVHMASALKTKLLAIYREDNSTTEVNSVIWAPYKTTHEIVFANVLRPRPNDINNVDVDEVVKKAFQLLGLP